MRAVIKTDKDPAPGRNRLYVGLVPLTAAALLIGIALLQLLPSATVEDAPETRPATAKDAQLESEYGQKWRELGVTHWEFSDSAASTFYVKSADWAKLAKSRRTAIMKKLWLDTKKESTPRGPDDPDISIMIHDELRRMRAYYLGEKS